MGLCVPMIHGIDSLYIIIYIYIYTLEVQGKFNIIIICDISDVIQAMLYEGCNTSNVNT